MPKGKIRHLAIKTADPERLAKFYEEAFEMEVQHRMKSGTIFMTDGYITLALLPCRVGSAAPGINHFGFQVEDSRATVQKISTLDVPSPAERPDTTPYAEIRAIDPDGNLFDISQHGYEHVETPPERRHKDVRKKDAKELAG